MIRFFKIIILIIIALIVAFFAGNNNQAVKLDLYPIPATFEVSLFVVVFACLVFGALLSGTLTSLRLMYWKRVGKNAQKNISKLESENSKLRKQSASNQLHKREG
jgi:uncharacterized integral membrane protein